MNNIRRPKVTTTNNNYLKTRRDFLSLSSKITAATVLAPYGWQKVYAVSLDQRGVELYRPNDEKSLDWIAEARIGGLSISGGLNEYELDLQLTRLIKEGVTVIEADSRLSDYLSDQEYSKEMQYIKEITETIHQKNLKVVWYIPALEVITANGVTRQDSFGRVHSDWLQVSFDGREQGVFYGQKVFWVEKNDESAWLCPNSPYREWFKKQLQLLTATGIDGIWLDVPIFDQIAVKFPCSCHYCRDKFTLQTGLKFPEKYDITDQSFWQFVRWRHRTITEFLDYCKAAIEEVNPSAETIAEIVALDHTGATQLGSEGSDLKNILMVWEVDAISETTSMAEASYDDWIALHNIYKYCRGATQDRPSWVFCYGYSDADAQLVIASAVAAQNNPYETRVPLMTSSVGNHFRQTQFNWIKRYSKPIFRSRSLASVAVIYSERNRDFLDATDDGGVFISSTNPRRDRNWLGTRNSTAKELEYMGDYRGLSILLYQNQIPTDIYPLSRVDSELLGHYSVLVLPYMASISKAEKILLLSAVRRGVTLIITGTEPGMWDENAKKRDQSLWWAILSGSKEKTSTVNYGKGKLCFWKELIGQQYLKDHDSEITEKLLTWVNNSGVESWIIKKRPVVIQPYIYKKKMVIHVLNYSWVGALENKPNRLKLDLSIPWDNDAIPVKVVQTEPGWENEKLLTYIKRGGKLIIPIEIGINAIVLIDFT